jgi:hypothetical protein
LDKGKRLLYPRGVARVTKLLLTAACGGFLARVSASGIAVAVAVTVASLGATIRGARRVGVTARGNPGE